MEWTVKNLLFRVENSQNAYMNKCVYLQLKSIQVSSVQNLYLDTVNLQRASSHKNKIGNEMQINKILNYLC